MNQIQIKAFAYFGQLEKTLIDSVYISHEAARDNI